MVRTVVMIAGLLACPTIAAAAGNSGVADPELEFGAIKTYSSQDEARLSCGQDVVIWADRHAGYYFYRREPQFGRTEEGAFACLRDAQGANYWSTGPMSGMGRGHGPGRVFPDHFPDLTS